MLSKYNANGNNIPIFVVGFMGTHGTGKTTTLDYIVDTFKEQKGVTIVKSDFTISKAVAPLGYDCDIEMTTSQRISYQETILNTYESELDDLIERCVQFDTSELGEASTIVIMFDRTPLDILMYTEIDAPRFALTTVDPEELKEWEDFLIAYRGDIFDLTLNYFDKIHQLGRVPNVDNTTDERKNKQCGVTAPGYQSVMFSILYSTPNRIQAYIKENYDNPNFPLSFHMEGEFVEECDTVEESIQDRATHMISAIITGVQQLCIDTLNHLYHEIGSGNTEGLDVKTIVNLEATRLRDVMAMVQDTEFKLSDQVISNYVSLITTLLESDPSIDIDPNEFSVPLPDVFEGIEPLDTLPSTEDFEAALEESSQYVHNAPKTQQ